MNNTIETSVDTKQKPLIDIKLVVSVTVLSLMVLIRDLGYYAFTPIYFVLVVSLISLVLSRNSVKTFFFFYITMGISIHGIALIPIVFALVFKNRSLNIHQFVFPLIILLFELFHLNSYSFDVDFNKYIVYALTIILFFYLLFDDNINDDEIQNEIKYYILGAAIASLIVFLHSVISFGFQNIVFENFRMGASFEDYDIENEMVTSMNPNQLAFYSVTAISLLLYIKNSFRTRLAKIALMIVLFFAGIMSGSRTWVLVMAIVLLAFFSFSNIKGKIAFLLITLVLAFIALRFDSFTDAIYHRYENRFEESNFSTAGLRTKIFSDYNQWLKNHPERMVYGAGALYYSKICGLRYSTHNSAQQIIVCYGVLGALVFVFCVIVFHNRYSRRNKASFWFYIPFLICVLFSQSGQFLNPSCMMLPFVATALPLKFKNEL